MTARDKRKIARVARERLGFDRLRPGQEEAIAALLGGHDFRPEYLRLGAVVEELGHPRVLALTATASPNVRAEIVERLHLQDARIVVHGFNRPNIWLGVERFQHERTKRDSLLEAVLAAEKPGIVYAATHRHVEELGQELSERGVKAVMYHGGMGAKEREAAQEAFIEDEVEVIVATSAFGLGIDKPNVRFVFHYDISDSLDSYFQEIGRAGRDGEPARAVLFYRPQDLGEAFEAPCDCCDNDGSGQAEESTEPFPLNSTVIHAVWGEGTVTHYEGAAVIVRFESAGFKKLAVEFVIESGALQAAP